MIKGVQHIKIIIFMWLSLVISVGHGKRWHNRSVPGTDRGIIPENSFPWTDYVFYFLEYIFGLLDVMSWSCALKLPFDPSYLQYKMAFIDCNP